MGFLRMVHGKLPFVDATFFIDVVIDEGGLQ